MIDWLALILLTAVALAAVVFLFGFTGCSLIVGDAPDEPEETLTDTLTPLSLDDVDQARKRTIVVRIEGSKLSVSSKTQVVITLQPPPPADPLTIENIYISQAEDDLYDPVGEDLTLVERGPLPVTEETKELPAVDYLLDETKALLIAFETGSESANVPFANVPPIEGGSMKTFISPPVGAGDPIHEAGSDVRQPGYELRERIYLVQRIQVR